MEKRYELNEKFDIRSMSDCKTEETEGTEGKED
jgi:hypothetical protein